MTDRHLPADLAAELREVVEPLQAEHHVPGVAIGLVSPDVETVACFGQTNVEHPLPVHPETVFQIASITKAFTATALLVLIDAGKLELDAPVKGYLPDLRLQDPDVTEQLTTRHLLTHASGFFGDHFVDTGPGDDALARCITTFDQLPQLFPPGRMWGMSTS